MPAPAPARLPFTLREHAAAVYIPACLNRMFGHGRAAPPHRSLPEAFVALSRRARRPVWIPEDVRGHCCGTPWSSKGYIRAHGEVRKAMAGALARWSDDGGLPVVTDASSCARALLDEVDAPGVEILDSIAWVHDHLLPRLTVPRKRSRAVIHPTCAVRHLCLDDKLSTVVSAISDEARVPAASTCCGMAGDRGWLYPELPAAALRDVVAELGSASFDVCLSSNRTCEVAMSAITGRPYGSFVLALEELTR